MEVLAKKSVSFHPSTSFEEAAANLDHQAFAPHEPQDTAENDEDDFDLDAFLAGGNADNNDEENLLIMTPAQLQHRLEDLVNEFDDMDDEELERITQLAQDALYQSKLEAATK